MGKNSFINYGAYSNIIFLLFIFLSCSKNNPDSDLKTPDPGFIEFKLNGTTVKIKHSNIVTGSPVMFQKIPPLILPETYYSALALEANSNIDLNIFSDSLESKNYHYDSLDVDQSDYHIITLRITYNGQTSVIHHKDDFADINISSYKNSRISGTFTGKLTPQTLPTGFGQPGSINITEGKINEVKVIY
jgi:hypothetical protein